MPISWEQYDRAQEDAAIGAFLDKVATAVKARNEGRNLKCWPLCSFGWKDADLDSGGCTGIKEIVGWGEREDGSEVFTVKVGGHKTLCPPDTRIEAAMDAAQKIASGTSYGGDWDGDSWTLGFEEDIEVTGCWDDPKSDDENYATYADAIVTAAKAACDPFEKAMTEASEAMDRLGEEVEAGGYGPEPEETDEDDPEEASIV